MILNVGVEEWCSILPQRGQQYRFLRVWFNQLVNQDSCVFAPIDELFRIQIFLRWSSFYHAFVFLSSDYFLVCYEHFKNLQQKYHSFYFQPRNQYFLKVLIFPLQYELCQLNLFSHQFLQSKCYTSELYSFFSLKAF